MHTHIHTHTQTHTKLLKAVTQIKCLGGTYELGSKTKRKKVFKKIIF